MKITNEQLRAIQEQEATRTRSRQASGVFTDIFARQMEAGAQSPSTTVLQNAMPVSTLPVNDILEDSSQPLSPDFDEAATLMEGMFTTLERYADQIASADKGDLREAYSLLESMNGQIAGFKERFPNAADEQPQVASLLNEIDVLATTETFKFNRGDYL